MMSSSLITLLISPLLIAKARPIAKVLDAALGGDGAVEPAEGTGVKDSKLAVRSNDFPWRPRSRDQRESISRGNPAVSSIQQRFRGVHAEQKQEEHPPESNNSFPPHHFMLKKRLRPSSRGHRVFSASSPPDQGPPAEQEARGPSRPSLQSRRRRRRRQDE